MKIVEVPGLGRVEFPEGMADADIAKAIKRTLADMSIEGERARLQREAAEASGPFLAGVGQGMTNVARGIGQALGIVSREDVKEARRLDAGLGATTGGKVGSIAGTVASLLPTAFIPGANTYAGAAGIGSLTGLLAPSASTGETVQNTLLGGGAGAGGLLAGRAVGAAARGVGGLVAPFTKKGQEQIAARTLQQFASDPSKAAASLRSAQELVPGSTPTMAQASGDAGLAQLERTLANNPETGKRLAEQYAAQRVARLSAVQGLAGTAKQRAAAVGAREAAAEPFYQQAMGQTYAVDDSLAGLLKRPAMQSAVARAGRLAENRGLPPPLAEDGSAVTGRGLQDIKMALDDMLSDPMAGIGKNEAAAVKGIRGDLIKWMEGANPAFKQARETFAEKSTPINTMDVARELMNRLEPALARYGASTKEHASAYAQALEAAKDSVKKATGINRPMDDVIDSQAKKILENIARDLGRKVKAEDAGRAVGSNTAQNLAAQNLLRRTLGPTGLPQSWAEAGPLQALLSPYTGVAKLAGAEQSILERLARASADPNDAAMLLSIALRERAVPAAGAMRYTPALALGYPRE